MESRLRSRVLRGLLVLVLWAVSLGTHAAQLIVFLDTDANAATGCNIPVPGGTFPGVEWVLTTTVDTSTNPPTVGAITEQSCALAPNTLSAPLSVSPGGWPVGVGNGTGGTNVIETYFPTSLTSGPIRIGFLYTDPNIPNGSDVLTTQDGSAVGPSLAVAFGPAPPIPTLGQGALLLLALLTGAFALWILRRYRMPATMAIALVALALTTNLIAITLDGSITDWAGIPPVAIDPAGDAPAGGDIRAAFAKFEAAEARIYFRADVKTAILPAITSANNASFTVGTAGSFNVTTSGVPPPAITRGGVALPGGMGFVDNGDGTGILSGSPASAGAFALTFTAANAAGSSPTQNFTLNVAKANQTVSFTSTAPANAKVGGATYNVTASSTSGLPVTLTVQATINLVCSISGSTVSFIGAGTCTINANQAGDANYNAAPQVQQSFAVGRGDQTITFTSAAPASAEVGRSPYTVSATSSSGLPVTLTIDASASAVCSILGTTVSFTGAGTCVIDGNQAGNATYNAAPQAQQSFAVLARTPANASLPFSDIFTASPDGQLSNFWTEQAGHFSTATNQAVGQGAVNLATVNGITPSDVAVQADVALGVDGQQVGLMGRLTGTNGYVATLIRSGPGVFQAAIFREVGGIFTQIAASTIASGTGTLRLELFGPSIKLFFNNVLVTFAQDSTFSSGAIGMRASTGASLDNFAASAISATNATLPFNDTFNAAVNQQLSTSWTEQAGNFQVASGVATGQGALNLATVNGITTSDVAVQADVALGVDGQQVGLLGRLAGTSGYVATLTRSGPGVFQAAIFREVGGVFTQIAGSTIASGTGTLRLELFGPSIKLFFNNVLVTFAQDSTFSSGTIGMRASTGASLDNFAASAISVTNATLPFTDTFNAATNQQLSTSWTEQAGNFQVAGGLATGQSALNLATVNGITTSDVAVQADVALGVDGQQVGLLGRLAGTSGYVATLTRSSPGVFQAAIFREVGGVFTQIAASTIASGTGTLRLELFGPSIKLFFSNVLVAFAEDATFSSGAIGMRASSGASLDNFTASAITATNAALPFTDTFNAAVNQQLSTSWTEQAGNFQVAGGLATGEGALNLAVVNGIAAQDVAVQADAALGVDGQQVGLLGRLTGTNGYVATLIRSSPSVFQAAIYKEVGGVFTQIAASTIASGTGTLRLELFGPSIKLFFNNVLVTYGQDTTFSSGGIGMRASSGASLDNFMASAITATNATLSFSDTFNAAVNQQLSTSWTEQAGNFQVTGGFATGQGALNLAIVNGISSANVTLAEQLSLPLNSFGGIVARYTGPGNNTMYIGQLDRLGDGTYQARIFKVISGVSTQIGSTATILASGGALQFTLNGASLTLSVDATPVVIATDSSISAAGSVGMRVGTGVAVDSFSAN